MRYLEAWDTRELRGIPTKTICLIFGGSYIAVSSGVTGPWLKALMERMPRVKPGVPGASVTFSQEHKERHEGLSLFLHFTVLGSDEGLCGQCETLLAVSLNQDLQMKH